MNSNMIGFIAFDLVLRIIAGCVMRVTFVLKISFVDLNNNTRNITGLRIPGNMIAYFEFTVHLPDYFSNITASAFAPRPERAVLIASVKGSGPQI
jgi:hypothetical protein